MKKQKYSAAAGIVLFVLAALFSISLLTVAVDFGGINPAKNSFFYSLGKIFTGVYGLTSVCIPIFLIVAGIQCFMAKWRVRNGVMLVGSIVPFFTLDAIEHICRMFLASESDSVLAVKLASTILIGTLILAAEYLLLSILGDVLENSLAENREFSAEGDEITFYADNSESDETDEIPEDEETDSDEAENSPRKSIFSLGETENADETADSNGKIDLEHDKIFLEQKEVLKDLINDGKTDAKIPEDEEKPAEPQLPDASTEDSTEIENSEDATISDDATIVPSEQTFGESNEPIFEDEPTIIEHEELDESEAIPETVEEEELLDDDDFAEVSEESETETADATIVEDATVVETADEAEENEIEIENTDESETANESNSENLIEEVAIPDFDESAEDDALISEINKVFGAEDAEIAENTNESEPNDEITESASEQTSQNEEYFVAENSVSMSEEDFYSDDADEIANAQPVQIPLDEEEPTNDDFARDDESLGVEDIFSQMEADAAANPVIKKDSPYSNYDDEDRSLSEVDGIEADETETAFDDEDFSEEDEEAELEDDEILEDDDTDFDDADDEEIEDQIDEINDIDFEEEVDAPDVISEAEVEATEKAQAEKKLIQNEQKLSEPTRKLSEYKIPTDLLEKFENEEYWRIDEETRMAGENLKQTLNEFGIEAEVTGIRKGPVVTMFELLPAPGVKLSKIVNLQDNIALSLAAKSVRIVAPIPGRHAVGIEIPNKDRAIVSFREIIEQDLPEFKKMAVPVILGKDISGQSQIIDIAKTPHLLIAGATGAGKSVCVNSIILSILYNRSPRDVKLIMVDPKVVELKLYNDIPHLLTPVVTEPKRALQVLQYCICEMERRYALLDGMGVRDIVSYNTRIRERNIATEKLPYIVVIIDEFADLMATSGKELETNVARLTAMSRAVGIHLVLATQRPSVNVITGLIKANIPSRIAFMVASRTDSNIIIDATGAEKLLGKGDMLYTSAVNPIPTRIQGTLVGDNEVERVVDYVKSFGGPDYIDDEIFVDDDEEGDDEPGLFSDGEDPLYDQALQIVIQAGKASASYIQRRLKIGYNRAARLVEEMEERGIVGPANGSKPREVIHAP